MVDKVKKREISELDEFIDVFNKNSEKITMCRYALNQDILLTIINTEDSIDVFPIHFKYQKGILFHLRTIENLPNTASIDKKKKKVLIDTLIEAINLVELNDVTFGTPEKSYDMTEELDEIVDCRWDLYKMKKR